MRAYRQFAYIIELPKEQKLKAYYHRRRRAWFIYDETYEAKGEASTWDGLLWLIGELYNKVSFTVTATGFNPTNLEGSKEWRM